MSALLSVDALRVTYGGVTAVNDVDLTVEAGRVVGLIGPNGAGKTSTIDALTGYHAAAAGSVVFDGDDITRLRAAPARPPRARPHVPVASSCSTTSRSRRTCSSPAERMGVLTALADLLLPIGEHPRDDVDWALELCGLTGRRRPPPDRALARPAQARRRRPRARPAPAAGAARRARRRPRHRRERWSSAGTCARSPTAGVTVLLVDHDMGLVLERLRRDRTCSTSAGDRARARPTQIRDDEAVVAAYLGSDTGEEAHA